MGIAERKEREKREMRELIIGAAMDLFVTHGFEKTSMRAIAKKIDYSPATLYLYFKDKDEIFLAIHKKAFFKFLKTFEALSHVANPMERLKAIGSNYIKFAVDNPKYYEVMFIMREPMKVEEHKDSWDIGSKSHEFLENTVADCIKEGYLKGEVDQIAFLLWSNVHGMSSLLVCDRLKHKYSEETIEELMKSAMNLACTSLEANAKT